MGLVNVPKIYDNTPNNRLVCDWLQLNLRCSCASLSRLRHKIKKLVGIVVVCHSLAPDTCWNGYQAIA